ncbi:MAG: DUF2325 domain-containing protein [Gammaproteobacteria bacterium]|nr:DUF2325 domain-containing protein [Gammaproteobacteria bacterium]
MCQHSAIHKNAFSGFKSCMSSNDSLTDPIPVKKTRQRRKIWELEHNYHCAVVGTCLTLAETRKLVSRFIINTNQLSEYDFHTSAVHMVSTNDRYGKKFHSYLDKKFKSYITQSKKMNLKELRSLWQSVLKTVDVIGVFWALITHPEANADIIKDAYGDIHMMSHLSGAGNRADVKQLKSLQQERNNFKHNSDLWQNRFQQEKIINEGLRTDLEKQSNINQQLEQEITHMQSKIDELLNHNSEQHRQQLNLKIDKLTQHISHLKTSNQLLSQRIDDFKQKTQDSPKQPTIFNENQTESEDGCHNCPIADSDDKEGLCGRCILYVGGRTSLTQHFKQLVENKDGTFLHHDGGIEKSHQELSGMIGQADVIVFPTNCVSHKAYWQLKKSCKKQHKPYKILNSSGLSSFSILLDEISQS